MTAPSRACWHEPHEVFEALKAAGVTGADLQTVMRFLLRGHDSEEAIDYATSLVMIRSPVRARLHVAPRIESLPLIERRGHQPPFVYGRHLQVDKAIVTDPVEQRVGSLPLTHAAAVQFILALYAPGRRDAFQCLDLSADALRRCCDRLNEAEARHRKGEPSAATDFEAALRDLVQCSDADGSAPRPTPLSWLIERWGAMQVGGGAAGRLDTHLGPWLEDLAGSFETAGLVVQGMGDLSFNRGAVGLINNGGKPRVIIPDHEPYHDRRYTCLIGWKKGPATESRERKIEAMRGLSTAGAVHLSDDLSIAPVCIQPGEPYLRYGASSDRDLDWRLVDFVVSAPQIVEDGAVVAPGLLADTFPDRRHLHRLGKIDPKGGSFFGRVDEGESSGWLLEKVLLDDPALNALACSQPIAVPLSALGCALDVAENALKDSGYRKKVDARRLAPGEYAWRGEADTRLEIFLERNIYPVTLVGIGGRRADGSAEQRWDTLYLLAWGHDYEHGWTIWQAADVLRAAGARSVLVIDEGNDALQCHIPPGDLKVFLEAEQQCRPLHRWQSVPIAFNPRTCTGSGSKQVLESDSTVNAQPMRWLKRMALRASVAFCYQGAGGGTHE